MTIVRIGFQTEKLLKKQQLRHSPDQKRPEDNKHVRLWSKIWNMWDCKTWYLSLCNQQIFYSDNEDEMGKMGN